MNQLQTRRQQNKTVMIYRIVNNLVEIPANQQGSKCPSLPGLTHWVNPGLPGLGFKPYFGKVGNTGE